MPTVKQIREEKHRVTESCGNVFADLGLPNPEILLLKSTLRIRIRWIIEDRKLRKKDAAAIWKVDPAEVSNVLNGKPHKYSVERLFKFLLALDDDIEIVLRPKPKTRAKADIICRPTGPKKQAAPEKQTAPKKQTAAKRKAAPKQAAPKRKAA